MTPSSRPRVLFVEDAFDQALLAKSMLAGAGEFEVVHVQDGDAALRLLETGPWHLLICDLNLPGADGFQVIRFARERHPHLGILTTTGYTTAEYEEQALRAGADNVLHKPLDRDEFIASVQALVSTGGAAEPAPGSPTGETEAADEGPGPGVAGAPTGAIIAVGGLPGDVEMGCGGTLMQAAEAGSRVVVIPLGREEGDDADAQLAASQKACALLGLKMVVDMPALSDTNRRMAVVRRAVEQLKPSVIYTPALADDHPARMEAFRVAQAVAGSVPTVLGYQTGTTGVEFRPTHFVEIGQQMALKCEALTHFAGTGRVDLSPDLARAYARNWGRFRQFMDVEAFEVIRGKI